MTGWVERDAINKTNCESRVIYVCVSIWNRLAIAFVIALSQLSLSLLLRQTVCIFCNATGKCVAVLCLCMFRRQNHVSAGEWRRDASNSRRTFALMLSGGILEAVDLEFKLLNNNNTCSHLAFIVLLFSFRSLFLWSSAASLSPPQQITACSLRINVPSIYLIPFFLSSPHTCDFLHRFRFDGLLSENIKF